MKVLDRIRNREGSGKPYPAEGPALFFARIGTYFWKFLGLNILGMIFSLPVITLPAALTAVNRVIIQIIDKGRCFLWDDFWEEFRRNFKRSLFLGLTLIPLLFLSLILISNGIGNRQTFAGMVFLSFGLLTMCFLILLGTWLFVLNAMLDLNASSLIRNAFILVFSERRTSLIILAAAFVCFWFLVTIFPFSPFLYILFMSSFIKYITCSFIYSSVKKRIIIPYEQQFPQG